MAQKSIFEKIKAKQFKEVVIKGITYKLRKTDEVSIQNLITKQKNRKDSDNQYEVEMVLMTIADVKGMKAKDLLEPHEIAEFTEEELLTPVDFKNGSALDRETITIYLGLNQDVLVELFVLAVEAYNSAVELRDKKKETSNTELNTPSTQVENNQT